MKKILSLLVAAMLCVSLAACGSSTESTDTSTGSDASTTETTEGSEGESEGETAGESGDNDEAFALYEAAMKVAEEATSMEMEMSAIVTIQDSEESMEIPTTTRIRYIEYDETNADLEMEMSVMGENLVMYYTEGYIYMDMGGMQVKYAADMDEILDSGSADINLTLNAIESSSIEDGGQKIKFVLNETFGEALIADALNEMFSQVGLAGIETTFDTFTFEMTIDADGAPTTQNYAYVSVLEFEGEQATLSYDINITYKDINGVASIDFPADLENYTEVEM